MFSSHPLTKALTALLFVFLTSGCVDHAYDFDRTDKSVTLAGDGLSLPLGSTKQMTVGSLIDNNLGDILTRNSDGTYNINYKAEKITVDLSQIKDIDASISFGKDEPVEVSVWLYDKPEDVDIPVAEDEEIDLTDYLPAYRSLEKKEQDLDIRIANLPKELASLDAFTLVKGAQLKIYLSVPDCFLTKGTLTPDIRVNLSQLFDLTGSTDDILHITGVTLDPANGYSTCVSCPIDNIRFDPKLFDAKTHTLRLNAGVTVSGNYRLSNPASTKARFLSSPDEADLDIRVELDEVSVATITAKFDCKAKDKSTSFSLQNIADRLGKNDAVLDFTDPEILLTLLTDLEIPVVAKADIVATRSGKELARISDIDIALPVAKPGQTASKTIRIAKDGDIKADVASLLRDLPDAISLLFSAGTDPTQPGRLVMNADYRLEVTPEVRIPVAFGPKLNLVFRDTLSMPASISKILKDNPLKLVGDITNTLPVQIDFGVVMTDDAGKALTTTANQVIAAGGKSDLSLSLTNTAGTGIENLSMAILTLKLTAPENGKALNASDYIQANLSAELPDGIHLSL